MHPAEHSPAARLSGPLGLIALTLGGLVALSCIGLPENAATYLGPVSVLSSALSAGLFALGYILGGWGMGRPLAALLCKGAPGRMWIQLALGLGALLWLSHMLGILGLLSGPGATPRLAGWSVLGLGWVLLADQIVRGPLRPEKWPVLPVGVILWAPGLALLIVAAAIPLGGIWTGPPEFAGFDAMSYHLQLPKEWAAGSRLWPASHNVYSYLPSFVEAAYLHLGTLMPAGAAAAGTPGTLDPVHRLLGFDGMWVLACQYLHAGMAIVAALLVGRAAFAVAASSGIAERSAAALGIISGAILLCTPWVLVVSTLPYNEAGLLAMIAGALLVSIQREGSPAGRAAAAGLLVGIACGCKPTALFMAGPLVGLLLLANIPRKAWLGSIGAGSITGIIAIAPWLIRNALASGNPVFPFATNLFGTSLFGTGHWTTEQIERYARNHHAPPGTSLLDRIAILFSDERGLMHANWGIAVFAVAAAAVVAIGWKPTRRTALLLTAGMGAQIACWMLLTHLQSRFLLPLLIPGILIVTLGGAALVAWVQRLPAKDTSVRSPLVLSALLVLALVPLSQAFRSAATFLEQNTWRPNLFLIDGVGVLTGMTYDERLATLDEREREAYRAAAGPAQFINLFIRPQEQPDSAVYLLGDSTPLYHLGATGEPPSRSRARTSSPVVYHTTWDACFLTASAADLRGEPSDTHPWSRSLRDRGVRYVLINYDELARLIGRSRYYDPSVSIESIAAWLSAPQAHLKIIRAWRAPSALPFTGSELFEIDLAPTTPKPRAESPFPAPSSPPQDRPR